MDNTSKTNIFTFNSDYASLGGIPQSTSTTQSTSTPMRDFLKGSEQRKKEREVQQQMQEQSDRQKAEAYGFGKTKVDRDDKELRKNYLNSLDYNDQKKFIDIYNQNKDFSFGDAVKKLEDVSETARGGGYRAQINAQNERDMLDYANRVGLGAEELDNRVQENVYTYSTDDRKQALREKVDNLPVKQQLKYIQDYENGTTLGVKNSTLYKNAYEYALHQNSSLLDNMLDTWEESDVGPNFAVMMMNIPSSAIKTFTASLRGVTNPADTLVGLGKLVGTEEGRQALIDRYGSREGIKQAMQEDPVGLASDVLSLTGNVAKLGGKATSLVGKITKNPVTSKIGQGITKIGNTLDDASDLGTSMYTSKALNHVAQTMMDNPAQNFGGRLSRTAGKYLQLTQHPLQSIFQTGSRFFNSFGGKETDSKGFWSRMKDRVSENFNPSGFTTEERMRFQNNPYAQEERNRVKPMIENSGMPLDSQRITEDGYQRIGDELKKRIEAYEDNLSENGKMYDNLKNNPQKFDLSEGINAIKQFFRDNGIVEVDGKLLFKHGTKEENAKIQEARDMIKKNALNNTDFSNYHKVRQDIDKIAKYTEGPTVKKYESVRKLRSLLDDTAKKKIPGLKKIDDIYSKEITELNKIKEGLVYKDQKKIGEWRDNFYSIMRTLNKQNRQSMKGRLEEQIFPGIAERVEAVDMVSKIAKKYQESPTLMKVLGKMIGISTGGATGGLSVILGAILDEAIFKPRGEKMRKKAIDEIMKEMTPEAKQKLEDIEAKMKLGIELKETDKLILEEARQEIEDSLHQFKEEEELKAKQKEENKKKAEETWKKQEEEQKKVQEEMDSFLNEREKELETIKDQEVDYSQLSDETLNRLREDDTIPQAEKDKIENILMDRVQNEITREAQKGQAKTTAFTKTDAEFIRRAHQLQEMEQNIGKVGKNKVGAETKEKQRKHREDQRDKLIQEIKEAYKLDQYEAHDKYDQFVNAGIDEEYLTKRGGRQTADKKAEQEIIDKLNMKKEQWNKQPAFLKGFSQKALDTREYYHTLLDGYEIQAVDKGDRIVKNGETVGNITYKQDGTIDSVIVKDLGNFIKQKKLLQDLPADTQIRVATDKNSISAKDLREIEGIQEPKYQRAYHGSSYNFDKFKLQNNAGRSSGLWFGYGHYVAFNKEKAKDYAYEGYHYTGDELAGERKIINQINNGLNAGKSLDEVKQELITQMRRGGESEELINKVNNLQEGEFEKARKNLYEVEIPDEKKTNTPTGSNYLNNDATYKTDVLDDIKQKLQEKGYKIPSDHGYISPTYKGKTSIELSQSPTQSEFIIDVLALMKDGKTFEEAKHGIIDWMINNNINTKDIEFIKTLKKDNIDNVIRGDDLYRFISKTVGSDQLASEFLNSLGYDGIIHNQGESALLFTDEAMQIVNHEMYQKYGIANQNEKDIKAQEGLSMENFKNGRTVEQIAKDYGIETNIVDRIATPEGEKALGMYADGLITLAKDIKDGTAPHELLHAVFDLVDDKRKKQVLELVKKKLGREGGLENSKDKNLDAEEWLADKFSEYFRTGKFEERGRPKGMWNKIKEFFSRVKDFITGVYKEKKTIKNLFDDIIENRIEHDMVNELLKNEADTSVANKSQNLYQTSSSRKLHINDENSSQYLEKLSDLKNKIDNGEIAPSELLPELKKILGDTGNDSEYVKVHAPNGTHILRVSDHYANSRNQKGHKYRNLSLVLKDITDTYRPDGITKDRFHGSEKIGMNEYVYDTKNMNTAKIHEILDGIQQLINEGHYTSRNADLVHRTKLAPAKYQVTQKSLFDDDLTQPKTTKDIKKESEEWLKKTREEDEDGDMRGYLNQISTDKDFYIKDRYYKDKGAEIHQHLMDFFNNHTFEEIEKYVNKKDSGFNHSEANMILKTKQYLDGDNLTVNEKLEDASYSLREGVFKQLYGGTKENAKRNHTIQNESSETLLNQIDRIKDVYKHAQTKGVEIGHRFDKRKEPIERLIENEKINLEKEKELKPYFDKIDDSFKHLGDYYLSHLKGIMEDYNGDMLDWKMNLKVSGYMADEIKAMHLDDLTDYIRDFFKDKDLNDYSDVMTDTEKKFIQRVLNKDFAPDVDTEQEINNIFTKYENTMASIRDKLLSYHSSTKTEEVNELRRNLFDIIGKTYDSDVQKRQDNIYEEMKQYGEKTLQKNNGEFRKAHIDTVDTQDLTSLKSMFKELKNYEKYNDRILGEKIEGSLRFNTPQGIYQDYLRTRDPNIQNKETVQQLVALSNMDENKLTQIVKDKGKIPMPSIAVMNPDIHHVDFGPIQFVFGKDTVDPKANKKNAIYGTDAYTPTFPAGSVYSKRTVDYDDLNLMNGIDEKIYFSILRENMDQITDAQARDITEKIVGQLREDKASTEKEIQRSIEEGLKNWKRLKKPDNAEFITANVNLKYDIFDFLQENGTMSDQTFIKGTEYSDGRDRLLTPENLLKAMKEGQPATRREVKPGSYKDMIQIIGSKIDDLEDVRKKNFGDFKFHEIEDQIQKLNEKYDEQVSNLEEEWDYHGKNIRKDIKKAYDPDAKKFAENLNQNGNAYGTVSEETAQGLIDTIEKGRQSSIRFSESKPQRIVDAYKEVQYILVPSFMKDKVQEIVKGTTLENKVETYNTTGDEDRQDSARTNALHDIQKKYGNVFFSLGGIIMPIAYLWQMMNGEEQEGQEA